FRHRGYVASLEGDDATRENIARAYAFRAAGGEEDVSGANADAHALLRALPAQRNFERSARGFQPAGHDAGVFVPGDDRGIKNVLEPGKLRQQLVPRRVQQLLW